MSKIICDVCGTSYAESAAQCPICGCVRSVDPKRVSVNEDNTAQSTGSSAYTFVKGGRFSKSNVKKRQKIRAQEQTDDIAENNEDQKKADKGLLITFIILLIAVAAVICYIVVKFLTPGQADPGLGNDPAAGTTTVPTVSTQQTQPDTSCQSITLAQSSVELSQIGDTYQIAATPVPADTADVLAFQSGDVRVATVTADGLVTAVGAGKTVITVTCGEIVETFEVTCTMQTEVPTQPSDPVQTDFKLNREDFTLVGVGSSHKLLHKDCSIPANEITWTSSKPSVATVKDGKVVAVSKGSTTITAEYNGVKLTCIARVRIPEE